MSNASYKTMRHIETVRNYLNGVIKIFIDRGEKHDQSKLLPPEVTLFEEYTPKLKQTEYGSEEYNQYMKEMGVAITHHYENNRHHPEFFPGGIDDMNLFDLIEMLCDWKAAGMRDKDGNIYKSIAMNQKRFGYSDEMRWLLERTMSYLEKTQTIEHHADKS